MEDILASIRKIIDQDERKESEGSIEIQGGAPNEVLDLREAVGGDAATLDQDADEPLELTEIVEDSDESDDGGADLAPAQAADAPEDNSAPHSPDGACGTGVTDAVPEETGQNRGSPMDEAMREDGLISNAARNSAAAALGSLAKASERGPLDGIPRGRPVEELVMEQLKPMLREWLDEHLPTIVERIVEREVRYLSRRLENDERT